MPVTECALKQCHKITATKLRALSYGVAVIVIVSKGKPVWNTGIVIKEIAVPYPTLCQSRAVVNGLLLTIAFKRNGCCRNRYG